MAYTVYPYSHTMEIRNTGGTVLTKSQLNRNNKCGHVLPFYPVSVLQYTGALSLQLSENRGVR